MSAQLSEADFNAAADEELQALLDALLAYSDEMDADLESGVITVNFEEGARYVINSHRAARQIWLAADRKAWHFDFEPTSRQWRCSAEDAELWAVLSQALQNKLGSSAALKRL